ncbi:MAG: FAD:protein FMN transferase [Lachnospiraceae bacterium]|nr:FAD:protein FMN transferase [Lachnospiraceae bacterium]
MKKILTITVAVGIFLMCSCTRNTEDVREIFAMDTYMTVKCYGENSKKANDEAEEMIKLLDSILNVESDGSDIYALNENGGGTVGEEVSPMIEKALVIASQTDGAFDISIRPLVKLWGFPEGVLHIPTDEELEEVLPLIDSSKIKLNGSEITLGEGQSVDLGGIAKGYAADTVADIYRDNGVVSGIISLGGNVLTIGSKPDGSAWKVGISVPDKDGAGTDYFAVLSLRGQCVITSGGYERYLTGDDGQIYHHILDPKTGYPSKSGLKSVSIVSTDCTLADALSTAVFVMGYDRAVEFWREYDGVAFDMVLVEDAGDIFITEGIKDVFSSEESFTVIEK